jgi:Arc/MetJ family transcription regulator
MNNSTAPRRSKTLKLDEAKLNRAQRLLGTKTATETVELALEEVIAERERNRQVWAATERLLKSGIQVQDVFGRLNES